LEQPPGKSPVKAAACKRLFAKARNSAAAGTPFGPAATQVRREAAASRAANRRRTRQLALLFQQPPLRLTPAANQLPSMNSGSKGLLDGESRPSA
jgi:hypothetical protein